MAEVLDCMFCPVMVHMPDTEGWWTLNDVAGAASFSHARTLMSSHALAWLSFLVFVNS